MTTIDDARQLLNGMDPGVQGICRFCYATEVEPGRDEHIEHRPDCVYLRRSRIVAALEAMHAILDDPEIQDCSDRCVEFVRRTLVDALTE